METPDKNTEISLWPGLHKTAIERGKWYSWWRELFSLSSKLLMWIMFSETVRKVLTQNIMLCVGFGAIFVSSYSFMGVQGLGEKGNRYRSELLSLYISEESEL